MPSFQPCCRTDLMTFGWPRSFFPYLWPCSYIILFPSYLKCYIFIKLHPPNVHLPICCIVVLLKTLTKKIGEIFSKGKGAQSFDLQNLIIFIIIYKLSLTLNITIFQVARQFHYPCICFSCIHTRRGLRNKFTILSLSACSVQGKKWK